MTVFGLFFVWSSLIVVSAVTTKEDEKQMATQLNSGMLSSEHESRGLTVNDLELKDGLTKSAAEMHVFPITNTTIYFQFLLMLSAIYYSMLLTNWGAPVYRNLNSAFLFNSEDESYWCQIIAMWISIASYLYSLIAPILMPQRYEFA